MKHTSMLNKQARKFKTVLKSRQVARHDIAATMGNGMGVLNVANDNSLVWVTIQGKPYKALCSKVPPQNGKDIWVGRQIINGKETGYYEVLSERAMSSAHSAIVSRGGYAPASRYHWTGEDPLMLELRAYLPLRIGVSSAGGMMVDLYRGIVETDTERFLIDRQDVDISAHIPTTEGKVAFVLITIDKDGNVVQTKGDEVDIDAQVLSDIPMPPTGTIFESGAVRVYYGQTKVQEGRRQTSRNSDFVDLRFGRNMFAGGGGGTPGGSDTQVQFNNDGVFGGMDGTSWDAVNKVLTLGGVPEGTGGTSEGLDLVGKGDELPTRLRMFAYGDTVAPIVRMLRAGGTRAIKTAVATGKTLGGIEGIGTDDAGGWTSVLGRVIIRTSEALTTTNHGVEVAFFGTPKGTTTRAEFGKLDEAGFNVPTGATYNINGTPHTHSGADGWNAVSWSTPTRVSNNSFTVAQDVTGIIQKGYKLKFTDTTTKYAHVLSCVYGSGVTTITTVPNTDYIIAGNPSAISWSNIETPFGFPSVWNYMATCIPSTGSFTTVIIVSAKYIIAGGSMTVGVVAYLVDVTGGSGETLIRIPVPSTTSGVGSGREDFVIGSMLQSSFTVGSSYLRVFTYNNSAPMTSGYCLIVSATIGW